MRLVVDTNVIVSAALKDSSWPAAVIRWLDSFGVLLKSNSTEKEVFEVLRRPRIARNIAPLFEVRLRQIFGYAELVTITEQIAACRDPKDDKFLELAVNGNADVIVSGGIPVITPAAFGNAMIL